MFLGLEKLIGLRLNSCFQPGYFYSSDPNKIIYPTIFYGLSALETLHVNSTYLDSRSLIYTPMLAHWRIDNHNLNLDVNMLTHLKHLKTIEINKSEKDKIDSNLLDTIRKSNIDLIFY